MREYNFTHRRGGQSIYVTAENIYEAELWMSKLVDNANEWELIKTTTK